MITGYTRPLYILPFDHRASYVSGLFGWKEPLNVEQMVTVADSKHVIYEGFQQAIADQVPKDHAGILVDEEFGSAILRDAASKGFITAVSTEKSGQVEFEFEYEDFAQHIEAFHPTFAKVLVRSNPEGDAALNQRQNRRLKQLSDYLQQTHQLFMFELLVPPELIQLERLEGDKNAYDIQGWKRYRPSRMPVLSQMCGKLKDSIARKTVSSWWRSPSVVDGAMSASLYSVVVRIKIEWCIG